MLHQLLSAMAEKGWRVRPGYVLICARVRAWLYRVRQRLGELNHHALGDVKNFFDKTNWEEGDDGRAREFAQNFIDETRVFFYSAYRVACKF
jgi:hypothetical protein